MVGDEHVFGDEHEHVSDIESNDDDIHSEHPSDDDIMPDMDIQPYDMIAEDDTHSVIDDNTCSIPVEINESEFDYNTEIETSSDDLEFSIEPMRKRRRYNTRSGNN